MNIITSVSVNAETLRRYKELHPTYGQLSKDVQAMLENKITTFEQKEKKKANAKKTAKKR